MRWFAPIVACVAAIPLILSAQNLTPREASLMLPEFQHVSGVVSDSVGRPINGASIQHLGNMIQDGVTDSSGHFELSTRVPAFVIRKIGYESVFVSTESAHSIQITLKQSEAKIPACSDKTVCTLVGWGTVFCFANVKGVAVSEQANDIDYGNRIYSVKSEHGRQAMSHSGGPMWGFGRPYDEDVWSSAEYSEKTYRYGSNFNDTNFVIDAKGKTKAGKYWRFVGRFGESAAYHHVDQESAALFDRALDGVCIAEQKRK
jgi:hypothetical protein